eukprot:18162-Eustigmatos_ZCMA.PRE.1
MISAKKARSQAHELRDSDAVQEDLATAWRTRGTTTPDLRFVRVLTIRPQALSSIGWTMEM